MHLEHPQSLPGYNPTGQIGQSPQILSWVLLHPPNRLVPAGQTEQALQMVSWVPEHPPDLYKPELHWAQSPTVPARPA